MFGVVSSHSPYNFGESLCYVKPYFGQVWANQGIYSTMLYPQIEVTGRSQGNQFLEWIYSLRQGLYRTFARILPEPQAGLAQGFILGMRGNIPDDLKRDFSVTGTTHLLAISGMNLSIIAGLLTSLGLWIFGRRHYYYIWLTIGVIWAYAALSGMNAPVLRSAFMVTLVLLSQFFGRQNSAAPALALAAAIMAGINPAVLREASFQLSFLAMAGLIFIAPPLQTAAKKAAGAITLTWMPTSLVSIALEGFAVSLGAVIAVFPVIAYYFGIISFVSPLSTLLALPAMPGIIVAGGLAGMSGLVWLPLGQVLGWFAWGFLSFLLLVVKIFSGVPYSTLEASEAKVLIWIYYPLSGLVLWLVFKKREWLREAGIRVRSGAGKVADRTGILAKWLVPVFALLAILLWVFAASLPDKNLHVSFLDVGQGDAILIQKGSQQILIDGGPSPQALNLQLGKRMPFWDRKIDLVILTHPDADHASGLIDILGRFQIRQALYTGFKPDTVVAEVWLRLVQEKQIKSTLAEGGERVEWDDIILQVLSSVRDDENVLKSGPALKLTAGDVSFLFTADMTQAEEFSLIDNRASLDSTVLKEAHHGSNTGTSTEFLNVVDPQIAVISAGRDNKYGHPGEETMSRLETKTGAENIYRTDQQGTIEFITDGKRLWIKTEK